MLKVLLKKQLTEVFRGYFYDQRKNRARSKASTIVLFVMFICVMICILGSMFFSSAIALCGPLCSAGLDWLYFAVMGIMAVFLGTFLGAFSTYTGLYLAKDNDLLLSMPIPVRTILLSRLLTVYLMGLLYSALAAVPTVIVYRMQTPLRLSGVLTSIVWVLALSVCVLVLSCAFGWCVAKISRKLKNKSFVTVLLSLVLLAAYYIVYYRAQMWIAKLIMNAAEYGDAIQSHAAVLVLFGRAGQGDILPLLGLCAAGGVLTLLLVRLLSRSFLALASPVSVGKKKYRARVLHERSVSRALLGREFARFTANPMYMLNNGLGVLFLLVGGVMIILRAEQLKTAVSSMSGFTSDHLAVLLGAGVCMLSTGNDMTAPSVSLEGKTLWLLQSLPVTPWQALRAKLSMQLLLTCAPALFCGLCTLRLLSPAQVVPLLLLAEAFVCLIALTGLYFGLMKANLSWTNEMIPIKQSAPVAVALFGGWGYAALLFGVFYLLAGFVSAVAYLYAAAAVTALLCVLLYRLLRTKGCDVFAEL